MTTTRETKAQFESKLRNTIATSRGACTAVRKHLAKIEAMDDAQFAEHMVRLDAMAAKAFGSCQQMARKAFAR